MNPPPRPWEHSTSRNRLLPWLVAALLFAATSLASLSYLGIGPTQATKALAALEPVAPPPEEPEGRKLSDAPELEGGVGWLNTAGPLRLKDLRGKIVVLDFWTYCCINCIHTLPDLAKLEKKYANQLVVVGVHSAKFENEKQNDNIRKAILRYEINHPVVNDSKMAIWNAYAVQSWPTIYLIDPEGKLVARGSGEGLYEPVDRAIANLIEVHRKKKTLNEKPIRFELARFTEKGDSPLFFPGKVFADGPGNRLFIADSTHHRIVITDLDGKKIAVAGVGTPGKTDGAFDKAQFDDPQGMALQGNTLFVADRKNNLIRALDLETRTVKTIAGTGEKGEDRDGGGKALQTALNSPWALYVKDGVLYIAMAGHHQIWALDLQKNTLEPFAGNGREDIVDGPLRGSRFRGSSFAQPSGLASDGTWLYVADSEVSAIRAVPFDPKGEVKTIVGLGLFEFGDVDGVGDRARLQHALGVAYHDGKLYVADTYNSKIKMIDPEKRSCVTFAGGDGDGWLAGRPFHEPAGISVANDKLYVADTNAHRIQVVDLKTKAITTLKLQGVEPPKMVAEEKP